MTLINLHVYESEIKNHALFISATAPQGLFLLQQEEGIRGDGISDHLRYNAWGKLLS